MPKIKKLAKKVARAIAKPMSIYKHELRAAIKRGDIAMIRSGPGKPTVRVGGMASYSHITRTN